MELKPCVQYLPLLWLVRQSGAAGKPNDVILTNLMTSYCFNSTTPSTNPEKLLRISGAGNGILLPKLFWPTVRKNCSSDRENLLKFKAEGRDFAKFMRSQEWFIQTVKG